MKVSKFKVLLYLKKSNLDKQGKAPKYLSGQPHQTQCGLHGYDGQGYDAGQRQRAGDASTSVQHPA